VGAQCDENDGEDLFGDSPSKPKGKGNYEPEEEEDALPQTSLKDMLAARMGVKPPPVKSAPAPPVSVVEEEEEDEGGDLFAVDKDDPHSLFGGPPVTKLPDTTKSKSKRDSLANLFGDAETSLFGEPAAPPPPVPVAEKPRASLSSLFGAADSDDGGLFDNVSSAASKIQQESVVAEKSLFSDETAPLVAAPQPPPVNKRGSVSTMSSADLFGSGLFDTTTSDAEDSLFSGGVTKSTSAAPVAAHSTVSSNKSNLSNLFGDDGDASSLFSEPKKVERKPSITASK
jgi:hypothetical protein